MSTPNPFFRPPTEDELRAIAYRDEQIRIAQKRLDVQRKLMGDQTARLNLEADWQPLRDAIREWREASSQQDES